MKQHVFLYGFFASLLIVFFVAGCRPNTSSTSTETTADTRLNFEIIPGERVGLMTPDSCSREAVLALYGDSAVVQTIYLGEGMEAEGVVLFPGSPKCKVEIYWDHEMDPKRPAFIRISGDESKQTDWKTNTGITIGTPIAEVQRINGKPFELWGFGWDFGGFTSNWNSGTFDRNTNFRFDVDYSKNLPDQIMGDIDLRSDDPVLLGAKPYVSSMTFGFDELVDLENQLLGTWQSDTDPTYQIVFQDGKLRHINNGIQSLETDFVIHDTCQDAACTGSEAETEGSWCFTETGNDTVCHLVLFCDGKKLQYTMLGGRGNTLPFTRAK